MHCLVRVIEARDIPKMDLIGETDAYCILQLNPDTKRFQTKVCEDTRTPVWKTEFDFQIIDRGSDRLWIEMLDKDLLNSEVIGAVTIFPGNLIPGLVADAWYPVTPYPGRGTAGSIHLQCQLLPVSYPPWVPNQITSYQIQFTIHEAKNVPNMDVVGKSDPYVLISLKGSRHKIRTKTIESTLTPVWEFNGFLLLNDPSKDVIRFQMFDKDVVVDDPISYLDLPASTFSGPEPTTNWYSMAPSKKAKVGCDIRITGMITVAPPPPASKTPGLIKTVYQRIVNHHLGRNNHRHRRTRIILVGRDR